MPAEDLKALKLEGIEKRLFGHDFVYRYPESRDMPLLGQAKLKEDLEKAGPCRPAFYFHIPFCPKPCNFCHYYKESRFSQQAVENYFCSLEKELLAYREILKANVGACCVFFGGGTPTAIQATLLNSVLASLGRAFGIGKGAEVSVESSPETISTEKLSLLRQGGFNRLSIGIQDFDGNVLRTCNRAHTAEQAEASVGVAREAGFGNINLDFIYGLPGQSQGGWGKAMEKALSLGPESITASDLRIQPNSVFFGWKKALFPSTQEMLRMYQSFAEVFMDAGYVQQFPYQFVKKGSEMRFLEQQWSSLPFIGVGASSCSFFAGWDYNNWFPLGAYSESVRGNGLGAAVGKKLTKRELMVRFAALNLKKSGLNRKRPGIDKMEFRKRFGIGLEEAFPGQLERLFGLGLLEERGKNVFLTGPGLFFHDEIARKFFMGQETGKRA